MKFKFTKQKISDVVLIEPHLFQDHRGIFRRNFCLEELKNNDINFTVKQANVSENPAQYTLRGFHYQKPAEEAKILSCITGSFYNVVLDIREDSPTYKQWQAFEISAENRKSIYVPGGCANAFLTLKDKTVVHYYVNDFFRPNSYFGIRYDDPTFKVKWPHHPLLISKQDLNFSDFGSNG